MSRSIRGRTSEVVLTPRQVSVLHGDVKVSSRKRRLLISLLGGLAALSLFLIWLSSAQAADLSATQMKVSVWPEYDDPRVLVINEATLHPDVPLPASVSFNIPKEAEIGMACEVDSNNGHACKTYQLYDQGDYLTLSYQVDAQHRIFLEYYYDAFPAGTTTRSFDFIFRPAFPATSVSLEFQEPLRSTDFALDPVLPETISDSRGFTYHSQDYNDVSVDQPLDVKVSYTKTDDNPSVAKADGAAAAAQASSASGGSNTVVYVVVGVLAFGSLLVGGYIKLRPASSQAARSGRRPNRTSQGKRQSGSRTGSVGKGEQGRSGSPADRRSGVNGRRQAADQGVKYCPECGTRLPARHRFCPQCGSEQP